MADINTPAAAAAPTSTPVASSNVMTGVGSGLVGSVVSGAFGLIGAALQNGWNRESVQDARRWEEQMMDKQNEWNLSMWNKTNEYNSPAAQLERQREAGINPLFYGLDGSSANAMSSATNNGVAPNQITQNPLADAAAIIGEKLARLDMERVQKKLMDSESEKNYAAAADLRSQTQDRNTMLPIKVKLGDQEFELKGKADEREAQRMAQEFKESDQRITNMMEENDRAWQKLNIEERSQTLAENAENFKQWLAKVNFSLEEKKLACSWYNANTSRMVAESEGKLKEAQILNINKEGQILDEKIGITKKENEHFEERFKQDMRDSKWDNAKKCMDGISEVLKGTGVVIAAVKGVSVNKVETHTSRGSSLTTTTEHTDEHGNKTITTQTSTFNKGSGKSGQVNGKPESVKNPTYPMK